MFVLLTLACLWLGWQAKRARDQETAVAAIRGVGGEIEYTYQLVIRFSKNGTFDEVQPFAPAWLRNALGEDFFITVCRVSIQNRSCGSFFVESIPVVTDETLKHLKKLAHLESLVIQATPLTESDVEIIAKLSQLKHLSISGPQLSDAGIAHLARLPKLKSLSISGEQLSDETIIALRSFPQLERLSFGGYRMTNEALAHLKYISRLRQLTLSGIRGGSSKNKMDGSGFQHVAQVAKLTNLEVHNFELNDADLEPLSQLTKLESAMFVGTDVTSKGLAKLQIALPAARLGATGRFGPNYASPKLQADDGGRVKKR